jgi:hypothetical protein
VETDGEFTPLKGSSHSLERRAHGQSVAPELMERDFAASPGFAAAYRAQLDRALAA